MSSLVEAFLGRLASDKPLTIARGQCVEQYGAGEAYLPVLAALDRLCRTDDGAQFLVSLRRYAPTWLLQLTVPLEPADRANLQQQVQGTTPDRMLREMDTLIATVTVEQPFILIIEDLHWSDHATVTLLSYLAQQQTSARLLILATYRPVEMLANGHPLRALHQDLSARGRCREVPLAGLSERAIEEYLHVRFPYSALPTRLARTLYQRTEGNPLFMVTMVDEFVARGMVIAEEGEAQTVLSTDEGTGDVPNRLRQLISRQIEQLSTVDCRLLEAASVAGVEFSVAEVAAMLEADPVEVEERCEEFARRQHMLRPAGLSEWPDGTLASRYRFHHALYQSLWQDRVKAGRWQRWQQRMGERKEAGYGERAGEIAAELAVHFAQGGDYTRAVKYHLLAGETALQRYGYHEASQHFTTGLELVQRLANAADRTRQELLFNFALAALQATTKGFGAAETAEAYSRARELSEQVPDVAALLQSLVGESTLLLMQGALPKAEAFAQQVLSLAENSKNPTTWWTQIYY